MAERVCELGSKRRRNNLGTMPAIDPASPLTPTVLVASRGTTPVLAAAAAAAAAAADAVASTASTAAADVAGVADNGTVAPVWGIVTPGTGRVDASGLVRRKAAHR